MYSKITILIVVALVGTTVADVWDGWVASWDLDLTQRFYTLPQTLDAAVEEGWTAISGVNQPDGIEALGYYDDPAFIILFNDSKAVGFQCAFRVSDVANSGQPLKYGELSSISVKTMNDVEFYTSTVLFYHDESQDIRQIWLQDGDGFTELPTEESRLASETIFKKEVCVPSMGTHYYNLQQNTSCEYHNPMFMVTSGGYVVGLGLQGFGDVSVPTGIRPWWEIIPSGGLINADADAPQCAIDAEEDYGAVSLHVWFRANPRTITCS